MIITDKYTFFWKDKIAQWNLSSFSDLSGITYICAEQYMMAKKSLLFKDYKTYELIMNEKILLIIKSLVEPYLILISLFGTIIS